MQKFDQRLIGFITTFENVTRAEVKDAFLDKNNVLVFVVKQGQVAKAIGRGGQNVQRISNLLKKRVKVVEFNEDPCVFAKRFVDPVKPDEIVLEDDHVSIRAASRQTRALLIGRDKQNIKELEELMQKYFKLKVKVT